MYIRPFRDSDLSTLVDLTVEVFRPFYEGYVHPLLGGQIFAHQHGEWEQEYRDDIPTLHDPSSGRFVAAGEINGIVAGYVSWKLGGKPHPGQIYLLAVSSPCRGHKLGHQLCNHAIAQMQAEGVQIVEIGTGDDAFHTAARELYEELGFTKIPVAAYLKRI